MKSSRGILLSMAIILFIAATSVSMINSRNNSQDTDTVVPTPSPTPASHGITITAAGDCTFATDITTPSYGSFVSKVEEVQDYSYFLKNVAPLFSEDDLTIVNFEGTLSTRGYRLDKQFAFRGDPEYVNILTSSSVEAASLANNHSMDYGEESFTDTMQYLTQSGILNFSGTTTSTTNINGIKVGLAGINALNDTGINQTESVIKSLKADGAQIVIAYIHWGVEKAEVPNDTQISLAHKAIDAGADLVLGAHPHVLQGIEKYNGRYIVYSLGNFCFGGNTNPSDKDTMLVRATLTLGQDGNVIDDDNISFIPCRISSADSYNDYQPIIAEGEEKERIMNKITERTNAIAPLTLNFR